MPKKLQRYARSQEEAARVLGRKKQTLLAWTKVAGCPMRLEHRVHDLGYDLQRIRKWARASGYEVDADGRIVGDLRARNNHSHTDVPAKQSDEPGEAGNSDLAKYNRARAEAQDAKAKLHQLELKERTGELVLRADVEAEQVAIHKFMREQFEALPRSLGPKLAGKTALEIQARLATAIEDIFRVLSRGPE